MASKAARAAMGLSVAGAVVYLVGLVLGCWHRGVARALDDKLVDLAGGPGPRQ